MEYVEIGGDFSPDGREWIVYAVQREDESGEALADIYIFEAVKRNMVMAVFGCRFTQLRRGVLAQILKDVNYPGTAQAEIWMPKIQTIEKNSLPTTGLPSTLTSKSSSKRDELLQILSNITDFPLQEVGAASTLEELGIDSLMATEVISDIRTSLNLSIDLTAFLSLPNIMGLVGYINEALGISSGEGAINTPRYSDIDDDVGSGPQTKIKNSAPKLPEIVEGPTLTSVISDFEDTRLGYDRLAVGAKAVGFWSEAYPHQARLVLAHVVEAFAELGCDLKRLQPGDTIPQVEASDKHKRFMRQLHRVLEDGKLISPRAQGFVRTDSPVDMTSAHIIHQQIIDLYPQHSNVNNMIQTVGSRLGTCLAGKADGLQVISGDKKAKKTLESVYEFWPLPRTATLVLADFMLKAVTNATGGGKFRILEVGAGTGGTTRYIVDHLRSNGVPFEYVFTDVSPSLVAAARRDFRGADGMYFEVLDIEKPVDADHEASFHFIIATNCVHATRSLETSISNLRKMLREGGALTLVEATRNMFWLDIVDGPLDGWWLFEDDRSHALVDENH